MEKHEHFEFNGSPERRWLTPEQFRLRHGLSRGLVYSLVAEGKLPHVRLHKKLLIKASALDEMAG